MLTSSVFSKFMEVSNTQSSALKGRGIAKLARACLIRAALRCVVGEKTRYANGVAVSSDGDFVLVVETQTCRVLRFWLVGPKKGFTDVFVAKLPGYPDGITRAAGGGYWVSLVAPLTPLPIKAAPYVNPAWWTVRTVALPTSPSSSYGHTRAILPSNTAVAEGNILAGSGQNPAFA
jgi:sugar lactone lactonase YvrE